MTGMTEQDAFLARMVAEADQHRAEVMHASVGAAVVAPRGGESCILAYIYRDGSRLVTHDGTVPVEFRTLCSHEQPDPRYFELVGGQEDGSHGWFDARCGRVFQWG